MSSPSMVQRSGDTLIVRSVVSGDRLFMDRPPGVVLSHPGLGLQPITPGLPLHHTQHPSQRPQPLPDYVDQQDEDLPQCKIKRNYNCVHDNCDFFTQNPRHYLLHIRDVHDEKVKIYDCPNCLYASRHYQKLLRHMKMVHGSVEQLDIQNVSRLNASENDCERPEGDKRKPDSEPKPKTTLKCSLCPFTTVHPGQLTRHERKDHVKSKFFSCEKCNYVTHIKARFTKHVKYHSMPMIKCDVCDFKTPYKWNLDRHMKNHGGTGAFYCSVCNFTADIKQSLTVHEMNHHIPPAGHAGAGNRRKNKVGGSDTLTNEEENHATSALPQNSFLMDSDQEHDNSTGDSMLSEDDDVSEDSSERNMYAMSNDSNEDGIFNSRGDKEHLSMQDDSNSKDTALSNGRLRIDNEDSSSSQPKKLPRPIPNLIPLQPTQQKGGSPSTSNGPLNLSMLTKSSEDTLNDISKMPSSSSTQRPASAFTDDSNDNINSDNLSIKGSDDSSQQSMSANNSSNKTIFKKKNASFFDKLKEKLMATSVESGNLSCNNCGHISKCLSEHSQHEKICKGDEKNHTNSTVSSGHGSTRCQYCRHRCKSSLDLVIHMQSCALAGNKDRDSPSEMKEEKIEIPFNPESEEEASIDDPQARHPMENVVFVWNSMLQNSQDNYDNVSQEENESPHNNGHQDLIQNTSASTGKTESDTTNGDGKKVFKCPHCSFWASTASRFHVHIVGHLNKKPFECSLCSYRSNWRWDITKHIRLKSVRDPDHSEAKVLMTDETGRRNYTKYNKYITVMQTTGATGDSLGSTGGKKKELKNIIKDITENIAVEKKIAPNYSNPYDYNQPLLQIPSPFQKDSLTEELKMAFAENDPEKKTKKSMWKCKRCSYRNTSREALLLHVKKHTKPNSSSSALSPQEPRKDSPANSENGDALGNQTYRCGHCYQVSNWKHVIQRHCRLKHNGDVKVLPGEESCVPTTSGLCTNKLPPPRPPPYENGKCTKCPFTSETIEQLEYHCKRHVMGPDSIYKCFICSYYVNAEYELLEHLPLHGITDPEQYIAGIVHATGRNADHHIHNKRYLCNDCPYETNSKSQFMYHEQFHKESDAPFKCEVCNYQVSKRHLLQQHMKVHGVMHQKSLSDYMSEIEPNNDTALLWITQDGVVRKMYKCTYCPYVNENKLELITHEKMHVLKDVMHNLDHMNECPNCTFVCENMREFWMHTEVHKDDYAKVICTVDVAKPDQEQLEHVMNILDTSITPVGLNYNIARDYSMDRTFQEYNKYNVNNLYHNKNNTHRENARREQFKSSNTSTSGEPMTLLKEMLSAPINSGNNERHMISMNHSINDNAMDMSNSINIPHRQRMLHFCSHCPARFTIEKEFVIHTKFHINRLPYQCKVCSYTARQQSHLMTHSTVHGKEYQRKTRQLQSSIPTHPEHRKPNVVMIVSGLNVSEPTWIVVEHGKTAESCTEDDLRQPEPPVYKPMPKHFFCNLCPAKFFKNAALHYHLSLHGGPGQFKCKNCDYSVKTIGNLVKHEAVHADPNVERPKPVKKEKVSKAIKVQSINFDSGDDGGGYKNIPLSGTDLFQHKTEAEKKAKTERRVDNKRLLPKPNDHFPPVLQADPQFGLLMHGNPDFIYPTYLKNGRQKEKRYKCHKCPSAFEKREQYKVHLSLHGSKQRYKCELCDYSVKYYANYVQHMRKHQMNADAHAARNNSDPTDGTDDVGTPKNFSFAIKTLPKLIHKDTPKLSMSEQQTLKLAVRRRSSAASGKDVVEEKKTFRCLYCPYINLRRDALDNHMRRHKVVSGMHTNFECQHCDYTAPQSHILRDHIKVHFNNPKHTTPDYYSNYNNLELHISKVDTDNKPGRRSCVFKSKRPTIQPLLIPIKRKKIYIMPGTGEQIK